MDYRNSLDIVRDEFAALVTGPHPLSIDGTDYEGLPDRRLPLDEVRDLLLIRRCPQATSDAVWAQLVQNSGTADAMWMVAAVGVAMPALTAATAALSHHCPGDPADLAAEVLRGFLDALSTVDIARPRIILRLRWAAYRAGHAVFVDALKHQRAIDAVPPLNHLAQHPDLVLAEAVRAGVLNRTEADLIGSTRLESVTVRQWAADHNVTDWAAYKTRRRAEFRLAAYLDKDESSANVSKADPDPGLQKSGQHPEVRRCA